VLSDYKQAVLRAEVRDKNYLPASDATVEARILGPEGLAATVALLPDATSPGVYSVPWEAEKAGSYMAEIHAKRNGEDAGRDVLMLRREDGVAEDFHLTQNRELLEKLAAETGGRYYKPEDAGRLVKEISYSEAGISVRETYGLWNMPLVFLVLAALKISEWLLRRKWGVV
jgi:hypothetical protein